MAIPPIVDLIAYQGDAWGQTFRFLDDGAPLDLTDAVVAAWAREPYDEAVHELTVTLGDPGEVTIGYPNGPMTKGTYDYDVEVTDDDGVKTWVRGKLTILRDVTNEAGVTP